MNRPESNSHKNSEERFIASIWKRSVTLNHLPVFFQVWPLASRRVTKNARAFQWVKVRSNPAFIILYVLKELQANWICQSRNWVQVCVWRESQMCDGNIHCIQVHEAGDRGTIFVSLTAGQPHNSLQNSEVLWFCLQSWACVGGVHSSYKFIFICVLGKLIQGTAWQNLL